MKKKKNGCTCCAAAHEHHHATKNLQPSYCLRIAVAQQRIPTTTRPLSLLTHHDSPTSNASGRQQTARSCHYCSERQCVRTSKYFPNYSNSSSPEHHVLHTKNERGYEAAANTKTNPHSTRDSHNIRALLATNQPTKHKHILYTKKDVFFLKVGEGDGRPQTCTVKASTIMEAPRIMHTSSR